MKAISISKSIGVRTTTRSTPPKPTEGRSKIAFTCNKVMGLQLFRKEVIIDLIAASYEVYIITPVDHYVESFISAGATFINYKLEDQSRNIAVEIRQIFQLRKIYKTIAPDLIFQYTIKPNIYGTMAAKSLGIPCISLVPGLGIFPDIKKFFIRRLIEIGYSFAAKNSNEIWFLNNHDRGFFDAKGWLKKSTSRLLPGEGVNTSIFSFTPLPHNERPKALFLGRLLKTKGIITFAKVAEIAKRLNLEIDFHVIGFIDEEHPDGISSQELKAWTEAKYLTYGGTTSNPAEELKKVDIVIVPTTFREGLNRVVQEALSIGRTVITTSVPGAGELIDHTQTGYIVPPNDPEAIIQILQLHTSLSFEERNNMAKLGSEYVASKYDVCKILPHYWDAITRHCSID